ncbi:hypothetical protein AALP_AA7G019100, partial [Arabis alpina]
MAISVSDPDPRENADTAQLDAAKRIAGLALGFLLRSPTLIP